MSQDQPYAAAPEMKNHLSMLGSMGAGARFSFWEIGGICSGEMRLGEFLTVRFVLYAIVSLLLQP